MPWILIALINPWMEEFYWRGLLTDHTKKWNGLFSILFSSILFSLNHLVFGIHSELFRGYEVLLSTFVMGMVWAITYKKTNSLRWVILSHFLVDFLNLSVPSFLDLYKATF
ncbi:CPBP family intramembrane metalloprotease [Chryseobacterium sp. C-2]|uniref:CPBP family intramembrane metalloprotease n=3 Tax=Chryseobacterium muglaense TaxID=2893752 RepID=A0ABR8LY60_9FLAO|nr:CPBP family intramembrane metalloprotease [Chryseobacterium muglaense]